jgi:hypothetical protein
MRGYLDAEILHRINVVNARSITTISNHLHPTTEDEMGD